AIGNIHGRADSQAFVAGAARRFAVAAVAAVAAAERVGAGRSGARDPVTAVAAVATLFGRRTAGRTVASLAAGRGRGAVDADRQPLRIAPGDRHRLAAATAVAVGAADAGA